VTHGAHARAGEQVGRFGDQGRRSDGIRRRRDEEEQQDRKSNNVGRQWVHGEFILKNKMESPAGIQIRTESVYHRRHRL
jgi:hypothetical protein